MKSIFNYDNRFFRIAETLWDMMVLNWLWVLCSLPIITVGASTLALYTVVNDIQNKQESYIIKSFFSAFCKNLKKGVATGMLLLLLFVIIAININFWSQVNGFMGKVGFVISWIVAIFYIFCCLYIFQIQCQVKKPLFRAMGYSFITAAQKLPRTLMMLALIVSVLVLSWNFNPVAMLFLCIGISGLCYMLLLLTKL